MGAAPGLLLALVLRWEGMAYGLREHYEHRRGPASAPSARRLAARAGVWWAVITLMLWGKDTLEGASADLFITAVVVALLLLAVGAVTAVVALTNGFVRKRRRRKA
ncbi:hypothetical protein GTY65_08540 [Streptomyces sp. SID8379]|uniref:hypothetical protein n=1 Tax=unclassified Streptomyces TaxID=2593676 RepID=UPI0003804853|nr:MULTISPECIES: hypothetical protein [unclassified Streptomyces]MYW64120.1 hypothetical protein [Streptomyces sp. SID8379]